MHYEIWILESAVDQNNIAGVEIHVTSCHVLKKLYSKHKP